jgi:hypothetical protein
MLCISEMQAKDRRLSLPLRRSIPAGRWLFPSTTSTTKRSDKVPRGSQIWRCRCNPAGSHDKWKFFSIRFGRRSLGRESQDSRSPTRPRRNNGVVATGQVSLVVRLPPRINYHPPIATPPGKRLRRSAFTGYQSRCVIFLEPGGG